MKKLRKLAAIFAAFAMIGCGNQKEEEEERITISDNNQLETIDTSADEAKSSDSEVSQEGVVELTIAGNDQMQFSKNQLRAEAGQTVRLTLEHEGELPENVMGHNFVLLKKGTDVNEFGQRATEARENNYIPKDTDDVIAHTEMIGGGESTTIEFEAPEAGTYTFICSFPGHYVVMQGEFIVE